MGDYFTFIMEGSRDPITQRLQSNLLLPRSLFLPKNSNIQLVWPDIKNAIARAKRFKPPLRDYLLELALNNMEGAVAIGSEGGAVNREFNTTRGPVSMGEVEGQPATWVDEHFYGKEKLKNNPKAEGMGLDI